MRASGPRFLPAGERALAVEFGDAIDPALNARVGALAEALRTRPIPGVTETAVSYRSLLVCYDPLTLSFGALKRLLKRRLRAKKTNSDGTGEATGVAVLTAPVCYGGVHGPDLADVAAHTGLAEAEVIRRHTGARYRVYMLGFLPGFAYLGGLDPALETPRLQTPRTAIPAGAVGIGGKQTGVYPLTSPGGWRLIGRTPLRPYDPQRESPILYRPGDCVRFEAVSAEGYARLEEEIRDGVYTPSWSMETL